MAFTFGYCFGWVWFIDCYGGGGDRSFYAESIFGGGEVVVVVVAVMVMFFTPLLITASVCISCCVYRLFGTRSSSRL